MFFFFLYSVQHLVYSFFSIFCPTSRLFVFAHIYVCIYYTKFHITMR